MLVQFVLRSRFKDSAGACSGMLSVILSNAGVSSVLDRWDAVAV